LLQAFADARAAGRTLFLPEILTGYPDEESSLQAMDYAAGFDHVVCKAPTPVFANHPSNTNAVLVNAHRTAIANGVTVGKTVEILGRYQPNFLVVYRNAVTSGAAQFLKDLDARIDGVIFVEGVGGDEAALELLGEEDLSTAELSAESGVDIARIVYAGHDTGFDEAVTAARGFVYLALSDQTGGSLRPFQVLKAAVDRIRWVTDTPVVAGFGIRTADDVRRVVGETGVDGVTVGTRLIECSGRSFDAFRETFDDLYSGLG